MFDDGVIAVEIPDAVISITTDPEKQLFAMHVQRPDEFGMLHSIVVSICVFGIVVHWGNLDMADAWSRAQILGMAFTAIASTSQTAGFMHPNMK